MSSNNASHVPAGLHRASRLVAATTGLWKALGNLESRILGSELDGVEIAKPVFVSGLARSGSTILTEIISRHPETGGHHYSDFPLTWTPYWWNSLRERLPLPKPEPVERAHRDRLMITPDSPEAVEEVLWMHFFPGAHQPGRSHVLSAADDHPAFEKYYRDHIRKLLLVRKRRRYVAKNNYHVTRLEYLLTLFPDARFVIPTREPAQQVASLIKQHRLFCEQDADDSRVSRQLRLAGHFEFGPDRRPILTDDRRQPDYDAKTGDVAWYARQWTDVYGFLHARMRANPALQAACLVVRYEDLCSESQQTLQAVFRHLHLDDAAMDAIIASVAPTISAPDYYVRDFSTADATLIRDLTGRTAELFGYSND
ncbi:MAG TPA: sulfotransferase [Woeseiaceae bacterium]|nr:sulfotransferase [Woeseiaceae bacterium]